jgi:MFS family permease
VASGFANTFAALLLARICVGVGEASLMPAAFSLLADYFPAHQRGRAFSAYMMSVFAGAGGALIVGGAVLRLLGDVTELDLGPLGVRPIWQSAFIAVGAPGFLVALMVLVMKEPVRQGLPTRGDDIYLEAKKAVGFFRYFFSNIGAFGNVWGAYTLLAFTTYCVLPWVPTVLVRNHGLTLATAGMASGVTLLSMNLVGALIAGVLGDRWTLRGAPGGKFRLTLFYWLGAVPAIALLTLSRDGSLTLAGLALFALVNSIAFVSASAVVQDMVPGTLRGQATAFWQLVTYILGNGPGPMATALASDYLYRDAKALPLSMLTVTIPGLLLGLLLTATGFAAYDRIRLRLSSSRDNATG